jgi:hypothetical protein
MLPSFPTIAMASFEESAFITLRVGKCEKAIGG